MKLRGERTRLRSPPIYATGCMNHEFFEILDYYVYFFYSNAFYFYTEEMEPISEEIYVKDEPEYDQVSYSVQASRSLFHAIETRRNFMQY